MRKCRSPSPMSSIRPRSPRNSTARPVPPRTAGPPFPARPTSKSFLIQGSCHHHARNHQQLTAQRADLASHQPEYFWNHLLVVRCLPHGLEHDNHLLAELRKGCLPACSSGHKCHIYVSIDHFAQHAGCWTVLHISDTIFLEQDLQCRQLYQDYVPYGLPDFKHAHLPDEWNLQPGHYYLCLAG